QGARDQLAAEIRERIVETALLVAETVLRARIDRGEYPLPEIVRPALEALDAHGANREDVTVRLHPADLALLEKPGAAGALGAGLTLVADATVARASCVVEAPVGRVVADVRDAFREVASRLASVSGPGGAPAPPREGVA